MKARKNDKPAISRAIVRSVREKNGRFLKKDEKTGLWFEIGDDAAREKTSQALRQRAPEMRKLLFDTEREEARAVAEEHLRQQRMMMGVPPEMMAAMPNMPNMPPHGHGSGGHAHVSQSSGNDGHGGEERHAADAEWARSFLSDVSGFSWGRDGKVPADESEW